MTNWVHDHRPVFEDADEDGDVVLLIDSGMLVDAVAFDWCYVDWQEVEAGQWWASEPPRGSDAALYPSAEEWQATQQLLSCGLTRDGAWNKAADLATSIRTGLLNRRLRRLVPMTEELLGLVRSISEGASNEQ